MEDNKFKDIEKNITPSIRMQLEQLRRFLALGKASVMVGAGFSKNAENSDLVHMKDWAELCSDFHKDLYGVEPSAEELKLKSALRLAQQVESAKGRNALDELIKASLPDDSVSPGKLHSKLVRLPWRDIFTTNYDTLLERAAKDVSYEPFSLTKYRRYNVVTSKDSLIYQPHPRIIKVHGSFPDNRPFIITEEDYRTYPSKHPEFVNTVRQALIETQFCLIGFSGDDPNFLSWLGWFRDILGSQMLPVYMVNVGKRPHKSEEMLFKERGVEMISTGDISDDVETALEFILDYINPEQDKIEAWTGVMSDRDFRDPEAMVTSIGKMRDIRKSYPNWIILPSNLIGEFSDTWQDFPFFQQTFNKLNEFDKLTFLYEYNWRLSVSFMPIWLDADWFINAIADFYNRRDEFDVKQKGLIDSLVLTLLSYYRITGNNSFKELLCKIRLNIKGNNRSISHRLYYEESLWHIGGAEQQILREILEKWIVKPEDYQGTIWKSRIFIEIGESDHAQKILENSIIALKRKLLAAPTTNYLTSSLSVLSVCLSCASCQRRYLSGIDDRFQYYRYKDYAINEAKTETTGGRTIKHDFNIGNHTTTWSSGRRGYNLKYVGAARAYAIADAYGYPIGGVGVTYNEAANKQLIPIIASIEPQIALNLLYETNSKSVLEDTLNRNVVMSIGRENAVKFFDKWLPVMQNHIVTSKSKGEAVRVYNVVIPMLGRLSVWVDEDVIVKYIKFIWEIFDSRWYNFAKDLHTAYNSLSVEKSVEIWWSALHQPIRLGYTHNDLPFPGAVIKEWRGDNEIIDIIRNGLIAKEKDVRHIAKTRLYRIYSLLPAAEKQIFDSFINENFGRFSSPDDLSHLGIWSNNGNPEWLNLLIDAIFNRYNAFCELDLKIAGDSQQIDAISDNFMVFVNCFPLFSNEQKQKILERIDTFLTINKEVLLKDDSNTLFGGLNRFCQGAVFMANCFISGFVEEPIPEDRRLSLIEILTELSPNYNVVKSLVRLSFIKQKNNNFKLNKERKEFLSKKILDSLTIDNDNIGETFEAMVLGHKISSSFALQTEIGKIINHIKLLYDDKTVEYLNGMIQLIENGIVLKENLKALIETLNEILVDIENKILDTEIKSDIQFYSAKLVGYMAGMKIDIVNLNDCILKWKAFSESDNIPNDVRNGYSLGNKISQIVRI